VLVREDGAYLASDVLGLLPYGNDIVFLEDGDVARLSPGKLEVMDLAGRPLVRRARHIDWSPEDAGLGQWPHYMLKEIHEQPDVLARTAFSRIDDARGDVNFESGVLGDDFLKSVSRVQITACGTALHAGIIGRYLIEGLAGIPVDVDYASEFRYRVRASCPWHSPSPSRGDGRHARTTRLAHGNQPAWSPSATSRARGCEVDRDPHASRPGSALRAPRRSRPRSWRLLLAIRMGAPRAASSQPRRARCSPSCGSCDPRWSAARRRAVRVRELAGHHVGQAGPVPRTQVNYPVALEGALGVKEISYMHAEVTPPAR
jgi:glucosamine--fructose-6-phosphate aminotransferase (isomerizing)